MTNALESTTAEPVPKVRKKRKAHYIDVVDLIVHKYDEADVIFRKASALAHEIIISELRNGEMMRALRPGLFELFFPALRPEARELRTSVIAERIAREIRKINPGSIALDDNASAMIDRREARAIARLPTQPSALTRKDAQPVRYIDKRGVPDEGEMRRQATQALDLMAPVNRMRLEELLSRDGLSRSVSAPMKFIPVWSAKQDIVTAYYCMLEDSVLEDPVNNVLEEATGRQIDPVKQAEAARVDATVLVRANRMLQQILEEGIQV